MEHLISFICKLLMLMTPTNKQCHHNAADPLLYHFLYHRFGPFAHDGEGIGVSDRPDCSSTEPWHTKYCTESSHTNQNQQVKVEPRSFDHLPLRFAHNQAVQTYGIGNICLHQQV